MLCNVLVHVAGGHLADIDAGLLGNERLHRLVTLAGNAVEADQVAEQDVVAIPTVDGVSARQCGFCVTDDRVGQVVRVDIGLWGLVRIVWLEVAERSRRCSGR